MNPKIRSLNMALTQRSKQMDELYHRYGVASELSDPAIWVLYTLYEDENATYTQNDLVCMWFYPKQTINYTVSSLVKNGWIELEQLAGGRNRKVDKMPSALGQKSIFAFYCAHSFFAKI